MIIKLENYINDIPEDFESLLYSLGNENRVKIILLLKKNESLSFSEIVHKSGIQKSLLASHLKKLELSGMIQNFFKKQSEKSGYSFYELTKFGKLIITSVISSYINYYKFNDKNPQNLFINFELETPDDFESLLKALKNKFRFAISLLLNDNDYLSFSDLVKISERESSILTNHLKKLEVGGIIQNFLMKNEETNDYSYYKLTKLGKSLINNLVQVYNDYYEGKSFGVEPKNDDFIDEIDLRYFNVGCSTWALPHENILGWIDIFSEEIFKLEIRLSNNLIINEVFNVNFESNEKKQSTIIEIGNSGLDYISFQFYSIIPEGNKSINLETLKIVALDKDLNELCQKVLEVEILKPIVNLEVINEQVSPNNGIFKIKISITKGFRISIPAIEIKVLDENKNKVEIKTVEKDPAGLIHDIPPDINQEKFIGNIQIKQKGILYFHFRIPFIDANNNKYYSNEEIVKIQNNEEFMGDLDYIYDDSKSMAET